MYGRILAPKDKCGWIWAKHSIFLKIVCNQSEGGINNLNAYVFFLHGIEDEGPISSNTLVQ